MGLSCNMCNAVLDNFSLLISHFKRVHTEDPNFFVLCGINGCGKTYKTFYGYRSHLSRTHKELLQIAHEVRQPQDFVQDIEIVEPDGDVFGEEPLSDEDEDNPPGEQLRCTSAAYLLQIKETHNLSQKALDDIVQGTNTLVSAAVKSVCVNIANQLQNNADDDDEEEGGLQNLTWQALFEQNSKETSPFQDLETESKQRQAFKEMFGLVVSMKNCLNCRAQ